MSDLLYETKMYSIRHACTGDCDSWYGDPFTASDDEMAKELTLTDMVENFKKFLNDGQSIDKFLKFIKESHDCVVFLGVFNWKYGRIEPREVEDSLPVVFEISDLLRDAKNMLERMDKDDC